MKFLLDLPFHKVLGLVLPLDPYISLTHRLLFHCIVRLKRTSHLFSPKGTLFAYCSSLRGNLHGPSFFLVYVGCQSGMKIILPSIGLSLVMGDHASSMSLGRHGPYRLKM